jgi:hypothetical protein
MRSFDAIFAASRFVSSSTARPTNLRNRGEIVVKF